MADRKPPIVISMTTNLRTGITSLSGVTAAPCPACQKQNTKFAEKQIVCMDCGQITKVG